MGAKKESKKKSKKVKEEASPAVAVAATSLDDDASAVAAIPPASDSGDEKPKNKKNSNKKLKKQERKKRSREEDDCQEETTAKEAAANGSESPPATTSAVDASEKQKQKAVRKAAKAALSSQITTHDPETNIPYSKIQLRRMKRRVKHGLAPVATPEEEREIREREKRERREEEVLYAADPHDDVDDVDNHENGDDVGDVVENEEIEDDENKNEIDSENHENGEAKTSDSAPKEKRKKNHNPPSKKTKRSKPVPPDYVCQACKNEVPNFTPHWIYDCPIKKTKKGCNTVSKRLRGLHDPPSRKVFVGGLPFECNEADVRLFFEEGLAEKGGSDNDAELLHVKLLKFEDSKRCKGQAFLTFNSDDAAKLGLRMNGTNWKTVEEPGTKTKKKKNQDKGVENKKVLKLKVTKVLNRFVTKHKSMGGKSKPSRG